jgi:hypothetical protein
MLEAAQIEQFITDGFVRIDEAFPRTLADAARELLWKETGCAPDDPGTWTRPVIRLGMFTQPPFIHSWCTRHSRITARVRVSRSRRCCQWIRTIGPEGT